jgi:hypothetical protein
LPQLSEETIKALPFKLSVGEGTTETLYIAQVAGFSDRITSVLVPESFIAYQNGVGEGPVASRLVVKVKDPSAASFANFLAEHGYVTNTELLRWSKLRAIVNVIALVVAVLALLLLGVSLLVFVLFVELTVARARQSVQLLQQIGYSPKSLNAFLSGRFVPLLGGAMLVSLLLALLMQAAARFYGQLSGLHFSFIPGWPVWACLSLVAALLFLQLRMAISQAIQRA